MNRLPLGDDEALVTDSDRDTGAIFEYQGATLVVEVDAQTRSVADEVEADAFPRLRQPRRELEVIAVLGHPCEPVDDAGPHTAGRGDVDTICSVAV